MKNSKGFTMIELIAVFLIVAALSVIGVVTVNAIMAKVEENYYADIEQELLLAGSEYYSDNQRDRPVDSYNKVELSTLVDNKYIEKILDKNGADTCTGNVYIFKNAAKYDYQACLSCGKRSDGTYVYSSTGSYCQNLVKDIVYVDARTDGGSTYSGTLSYENTDWTSANYVNFTFSMNSGTVSKYVVTNLSTLENNDCIATNNVCTKKINTTGSYSVTAYGVEGNILGSAKYFNAKFDRTAPTFDVTLSSGKFRYGFDEHSYHFSSKIINLKDDNGIKSVTYTLTGTKVIAQNEDITNTLSIDKDLPSGRYTLTVKVVDVAGNTKSFTGSGDIEVIMPIKIIYTDIEGTVFDKGFKEVVNGLAYNYSGNFTYGYNTKYPDVESYFYLDNAKKNRIYSTTLVNSPDPYTIYAFDSYILQAPPTASEYCSNPVYNGNLQVITKAADVGFTFSNNKKTDYSSSGYDVVATLGNLYMWTTLNRNDVKINCNITPKPVTVTMVPKTFIYDGTDKYSDDCTADSLVAGHSVTCVHNITAHGTGTATANPKTITIKDSGGVNVNKNYKITKGESTLTVNPRPITITSPSISCTYGACKDTTIASNLKNNTTASNLVDGWTFTIGASNSTVASRLDKNAGTYNTGADVGSTFTIKDASGQDITNRCTITYKAGVLTVNKAEPSISFGVSAGDEIVGTSSIPITVTSEVAGSISVTTSNSDVSVSGTGSIAAGGSRTLTVTGKNTYGSTTLSITLTSSNSNYKNITKTVTVNTFKIADKGNCTPNLVYNGETQYLGENGIGVMFINNGRKNVGTTTVTVSALTGFKFSDGTTSKTLSCSVSKRSITVTSNNLSCTYGNCRNLGHSYSNTTSNLPSMFSIIQSPQMPDFNTYDVGTYEKVLAPGDFKVYITSGMTDVTSNFTINHVKGTLTITPASIS